MTTIERINSLSQTAQSVQMLQSYLVNMKEQWGVLQNQLDHIKGKLEADPETLYVVQDYNQLANEYSQLVAMLQAEATTFKTYPQL
jgi:hypothetical protein